MRVAFKPTSTIARRQNTVSREGQDVELLAKGRHDPCVVPRAVPMVEAMVAITLADQLLQASLVLQSTPLEPMDTTVSGSSLWKQIVNTKND